MVLQAHKVKLRLFRGKGASVLGTYAGNHIAGPQAVCIDPHLTSANGVERPLT
jgi:hypothetical protein